MAGRLKLNLKGFRELRTGPAATRLVREAAEKVAGAAGEGFEAQMSPGKSRARAVVVPTTPEAARQTAEEPARLIAALEAARD
jgi:hypothetical protein